MDVYTKMLPVARADAKSHALLRCCAVALMALFCWSSDAALALGLRSIPAEAVYSERLHLPVDARLRVELRGTAGDYRLLAVEDLGQGPIPFRIDVPDGVAYSLAADVRVGDELWLRTKEPIQFVSGPEMDAPGQLLRIHLSRKGTEFRQQLGRLDQGSGVIYYIAEQRGEALRNVSGAVIVPEIGYFDLRMELAANVLRLYVLTGRSKDPRSGVWRDERVEIFWERDDRSLLARHYLGGTEIQVDEVTLRGHLDQAELTIAAISAVQDADEPRFHCQGENADQRFSIAGRIGKSRSAGLRRLYQGQFEFAESFTPLTIRWVGDCLDLPDCRIRAVFSKQACPVEGVAYPWHLSLEFDGVAGFSGCCQEPTDKLP